VPDRCGSGSLTSGRVTRSLFSSRAQRGNLGRVPPAAGLRDASGTLGPGGSDQGAVRSVEHGLAQVGRGAPPHSCPRHLSARGGVPRHQGPRAGQTRSSSRSLPSEERLAPGRSSDAPSKRDRHHAAMRTTWRGNGPEVSLPRPNPGSPSRVQVAGTCTAIGSSSTIGASTIGPFSPENVKKPWWAHSHSSRKIRRSAISCPSGLWWSCRMTSARTLLGEVRTRRRSRRAADPSASAGEPHPPKTPGASVSAARSPRRALLPRSPALALGLDFRP
jgi:hypothetical protein